MFINKLNVAQIIKVIDADGKADSINLQPRGRVELPPGYSVHPQHASAYKDTVKDTAGVIDAAIAAQQAEMKRVTETT